MEIRTHREIMTHHNNIILKIHGAQRNTGSTGVLLVEHTIIWLNKKHLCNNLGLCQKKIPEDTSSNVKTNEENHYDHPQKENYN